MADGSDKTRHPMVNYIAAPPKGLIHLGVDDLSGENKDCISQAKRMAERMKATGKEKCFFLAVLDGALRACFPHLEKEMPWLTAIWCGCHVLSLFFKDCFTKVDELKEHLALVKRVIHFVKDHQMPLSIFREFSHVELILPGETRYASAVVTVARHAQCVDAPGQGDGERLRRH
jgi:hypothetical protein